MLNRPAPNNSGPFRSAAIAQLGSFGKRLLGLAVQALEQPLAAQLAHPLTTGSSRLAPVTALVAALLFPLHQPA